MIYSDWKECIVPLIDSLPPQIDPRFFGVDDYFAAKSLVASRSFEIDDYYGSGMVPLADLYVSPPFFFDVMCYASEFNKLLNSQI